MPNDSMDPAEQLLELADDAIILTDASGVITYWNGGAARMYGWEKQDALGQNVHTLLRTESASPTQKLEAILRNNSHWEGELHQIRRDGAPILVASRWTAADDGSPRLQINTDITARKQTEEALRESEERYRRFVTEDFTANLVVRPDGQIVACNPAFVNTFGFDSMEEAVAGNFMALLRTRQDAVELLEIVRQQGIVDRHELEMRQRDGDPVYVVARVIGRFSNRL